MAGNWVRDRQIKPKERRVVLVYKPNDPAYEEIEALLEVIPYGKGNKMLLEALRFGCAATLRKIKTGQGEQAQEARPSGQPAQVVAPIAQTTPAQPPAPQMNQAQPLNDQSETRTNTGGSASFTPAALDMLEMGGRGSK